MYIPTVFHKYKNYKYSPCKGYVFKLVLQKCTLNFNLGVISLLIGEGHLTVKYES